MAKTNLFRTADNCESYAPGQMIFEEGQPGAVLYVVKEGEVEILVGSVVVETLDAGEIFGEMALIDGKGIAAPRHGPKATARSCRSASSASRSWCSRRRISPSP